MTTQSTPAGSATPKEISAIYLALMAMLALAGLDQSIVATALPRIGADLGGIAHLSWVVTAYALASTATMPLYGKLSDQYGRKPLLYAAIILFLVGSVLCGLAQDMTQLIVFRALQGIGAGGFLPLAQIVIGDLVAPAERGRRQGSIIAVFATTSLLGPLIGGLLTDWLSWHWIFYVNMPIGALALYLIASAMRSTVRTQAHKIDYLGSILLVGTVTAALLVLALGGTSWAWRGIEVIVTSILALVMLAWLLVHVRRVPEPVLPPDLFHSGMFNIGSLVMALTYMPLMGSSVFFPLLFQNVMGASPAHSGLMTMPLMLGMVLTSMINGRLMSRGVMRYKQTQIVGLAIATLAFALLAWAIYISAGIWVLEPAIFALGAGLGLITPNMTIMVQQALPAAQRGVGTAMLGFFRSLGGVIGVTGSGAILALELHGRSATPALYHQAISHIFIAGTGLLIVALLVLLFLPEGSPEQPAKAG